MARFIARLAHLFDRLFPRARVGGRASGADYSDWEYEVAQRLLDEYGAQFGKLEGARMLDIGCGLGGKTAAYAERGGWLVGVDVAPEHLEQAARWTRSRGADARFVAAGAEKLPFADGSFDKVIANDSLEHFSDPEAAFSELSRVLRPGGRLYLFFTPWGSPLGSHLYDYIRTPWCHLLYPESVLLELLRIILEERGEKVQDASELMIQYRTELNRITVGRYRRIRASHPELEVVLERLAPPKYGALAPLTRLPYMGELFTGTVAAVLRKR